MDMTKKQASDNIEAHIMDVARRVLSGDPSLEHSWGDHHAKEPEYFWLIFHENFDPDGGLVADFAVAVLGCDPADGLGASGAQDRPDMKCRLSLSADNQEE